MIYDCFHFNDELDLLDFRLHHHSFADKFILIESTKTYTGKDKTLLYEKNKDAFKKFSHKIYHIILDYPFEGNEDWKYEHMQRNVLKGFNFNINDTIIYADCDEILRDESVIPKFLGNIWSLQMDLCFYYFNLRLKDITHPHEDYHLNSCFRNKFHMAKIFPAWCLKTVTNIYNLRQHEIENPVSMIPNAGWHFSNLGSPERILNKLQAISHWGEYSFQGLTSEKIKNNKNNLIDPLGRDGCIYEVIPDRELPEYLINNRERLLDYFIEGKA